LLSYADVMATGPVQHALQYLARTGNPNATALRALTESELRDLKTQIRETGTPIPLSIGRAIDSFIVERRGRRLSGARADAAAPASDSRLPSIRMSASLVALIASAVGLALMLVRMNRWP
jgi:hypothetical protein